MSLDRLINAIRNRSTTFVGTTNGARPGQQITVRGQGRNIQAIAGNEIAPGAQVIAYETPDGWVALSEVAQPAGVDRVAGFRRRREEEFVRTGGILFFYNFFGQTQLFLGGKFPRKLFEADGEFIISQSAVQQFPLTTQYVADLQAGTSFIQINQNGLGLELTNPKFRFMSPMGYGVWSGFAISGQFGADDFLPLETTSGDNSSFSGGILSFVFEDGVLTEEQISYGGSLTTTGVQTYSGSQSATINRLLIPGVVRPCSTSTTASAVSGTGENSNESESWSPLIADSSKSRVIAIKNIFEGSRVIDSGLTIATPFSRTVEPFICEGEENIPLFNKTAWKATVTVRQMPIVGTQTYSCQLDLSPYSGTSPYGSPAWEELVGMTVEVAVQVESGLLSSVKGFGTVIDATFIDLGLGVRRYTSMSVNITEVIEVDYDRNSTLNGVICSRGQSVFELLGELSEVYDYSVSGFLPPVDYFPNALTGFARRTMNATGHSWTGGKVYVTNDRLSSKEAQISLGTQTQNFVDEWDLVESPEGIRFVKNSVPIRVEQQALLVGTEDRFNLSFSPGNYIPR